MPLGPILIFDKSFLQSLNVDEAVWLDNFFLTMITPLFFVETLADLEKEVHRGRTPEQVVGSLAYKTPDLQSYMAAHHDTLLWADLHGQKVPMDGRIPRAGGRYVTLDGKQGVIYERTPEEEAFARWQRHEFLDLERQIAKVSLEDAINSKREAFRTELRDQLQSEVDRFCSGLSLTIASLIVSAKTKYDSSLSLLRKARRRRYATAFVITALVYVCIRFVYSHSGRPAPTSFVGEAMLNLGCGVLLEVIVLAVVKARENVPKLLTQTREDIQVKLKEDVRHEIDTQLSALVFNSLNEQVIATRLTKIYVLALDLPSGAWQARAKDTLDSLRKVFSSYSALRTAYAKVVEQVRQDASQYFVDSSRNLSVLNGVASRIKEKAIEPSFDLLAATREELLLVKTDVDSVVFD